MQKHSYMEITNALYSLLISEWISDHVALLRWKNNNSNTEKCLSHRDHNKEQIVETKTFMARRTICSEGILVFRDKLLSLCNLRITGEQILIVAVIYIVSSFAFYYYVCAIDFCLCWGFWLFFL